MAHCAASRQVAFSIPEGVVAIFHCHNPSGRTVVLGSTQPVTEMSITRPVLRADNVATFHVLIVLKSGSLNLL